MKPSTFHYEKTQGVTERSWGAYHVKSPIDAECNVVSFSNSKGKYINQITRNNDVIVYFRRE